MGKHRAKEVKVKVQHWSIKPRITVSFVKMIEKWAPIILAGYTDKIKEIRFACTLGEVRNWNKEFKRLYKKGIVYIKAPEGYHHFKDVEWFTIHELSHIRQIVSGELKKIGHRRYRYKGKVYNLKDLDWDKFNELKEADQDKANAYQLRFSPWEEEAWDRAEAVGNL